jgi:molybdopterin-guanine dinucleotide biosynthesis protein A
VNEKSSSPLIGLYTAFKELSKLGYKKVFVLSCDNPLVKYEVIEFLINQCNEFDCCIPRWKNNYLEPLLAIYTIDKAFKTSLRNIVEGRYKLTKIISSDWKTNYISIEQNIKIIDFQLMSFKNINTIEDIKLLE